MTLRTFTVRIGSLELDARADVVGKFRPAVTQADPEYCHPEESPEIDVRELWTLPPAFSDVRRVDMLGLLDDADIYAGVRDQILEQLAEAEREGDPDAGDRATGDEP
jgi:hypothetical protein